jgi:hypothetical protein
MTNQPTPPEDDAQDMIDAEIERLCGDHDPIPLIDVCAMICDREGGDVDDFMRSSILIDLVQGSQSNPNGVIEQIREALELLFN